MNRSACNSFLLQGRHQVPGSIDDDARVKTSYAEQHDRSLYRSEYNLVGQAPI